MIDRGNLDGPRNPWQPPVDGYRHLDEVVAWNRAVMDAVGAELRQGRLPILLGGDHCLGVGSITAVARHCRDTGKQLRVLWLDAHADFNTHDVTPSGNVHGMPVACLCGIGPDALTRLGGDAPAVLPAQIRQVGIRSVDQGEKRLIKEHGLDVYDMRYIDEVGMKRAMEEALEGMDADTHLHEAQLVMEMIADSGRMGSLDIMELNPALDSRNATANLAVDLVESLFGKSTLMRD